MNVNIQEGYVDKNNQRNGNERENTKEIDDLLNEGSRTEGNLAIDELLNSNNKT
jgi:hypothetical protein